MGMHASAGCRTYSSLNANAQRLVRMWSMRARDRRATVSVSSSVRRYKDELRLVLVYTVFFQGTSYTGIFHKSSATSFAASWKVQRLIRFLDTFEELLQKT